MSDPAAARTAATFCATFVDEWVRGGVRHAVVAPGSRSTPMAVALAARDELTVHVVHDERAAAFMALGIGRVDRVPAVLLCTSGTAAAHFHAAVIEAHQDHVPMLVCTADRPPELRDVGAPQTVDQLHLYGRAVRWFADLGVPSAEGAGSWRATAARLVADACGPLPGPVHVNLPFREPLLAEAGDLPVARSSGPWSVRPAPAVAAETDLRRIGALVSEHQRGVIVAGGGAPASVHRLAERLGWPVLADPRSPARVPAPATIAAFDALLRHVAFAADHRPSIVVRVGTPPASKVLEQWLAASGADEVVLSAVTSWSDPGHRIGARVVGDLDDALARLAALVPEAAATPWLARWRRAEGVAQSAIDDTLRSSGSLTEPMIARTVVGAVPDGGRLVVSSSMPVRDVEWFAAPRTGLQVHANRGANGIDGVISTAIGVAAASAAPTAALLGDLAFLHDSSALVALAQRSVDLAIVVVDNDGGGIFSFLPQRKALDRDRYEQLFGTPHGTDLAALAAAHHLPADVVTDADQLAHALRAGTGCRLVIARTERDGNVAFHDELTSAVRRALDAMG